jgi:hypothetical protein
VSDITEVDDVEVDRSWIDNLEDAPGRGRPRKEKIEGGVKKPIELTPQAVATIERVKAIHRLVSTTIPTQSEIICAALEHHVERVERETRAAAEYLRECLPVAQLRAARSLPEPQWVPLTLNAEANAAIQALYDHFTSRGIMFRDQGELIVRTLKDAAEWVAPDRPFIVTPIDSETTAALDILANYYGKSAAKKSRGELAAQVLRDAALSIATSTPTVSAD